MDRVVVFGTTGGGSIPSKGTSSKFIFEIINHDAQIITKLEIN